MFDVYKIRDDFPILGKKVNNTDLIYFDNAATSPLRKEVIESINEVLLETYGNPSSNHSFGRKAKTLIENSRKTIASELNASPQEIIFTSGGTESDNTLLRSAVEDLDVKTIISTKIEHHAILHALDYLEKKNISIVYLPVDKNERSSRIKKLETQSRNNNQSQIFIETPYRNQLLFDELKRNLNNHTFLCVAKNIGSKNQKIKTMQIKDWKSKKEILEKEPSIFIFHSGMVTF